MQVLDWIIVAVIVILMLWAIKMERCDLFCPEGPSTKEADKALTGAGNGKGLYQSQFREGDSIEVSLNKLEVASNATTARIKWRTAFFASILTAIIFNLILYPSFDLRRFGISILILFVGYLGFLMYYDTHYYAHINKNLLDNIKNIRSNLNLY